MPGVRPKRAGTAFSAQISQNIGKRVARCSGDQKEAIACVAARSSRAKGELGRFRVPPLRCSARGLLAHIPIGWLELKTAQHLKHVLSEHSALYF